MLSRAAPGNGDLLTIDLNCDMGEGVPTDALIFPLISSANIACGGHAGDTGIMRRSVEMALLHGVAVGAHPSYPDRQGFGRADILESAPGKGDAPLSFKQLLPALTGQISALLAECRELGVPLRHVKPHGALYNRAARDSEVAEIVAAAVRSADPGLILYGLSGSVMRAAASGAGLRFASEAFADRSYRADGTLTPRSEAGALIEDPAAMLEQVLSLVRRHEVRSVTGTFVPILADTVCLHGDGAHAVEFAMLLRGQLESRGIVVAAPI